MPNYKRMVYLLFKKKNFHVQTNKITELVPTLGNNLLSISDFSQNELIHCFVINVFIKCKM